MLLIQHLYLNEASLLLSFFHRIDILSVRWFFFYQQSHFYSYLTLVEFFTSLALL